MDNHPTKAELALYVLAGADALGPEIEAHIVQCARCQRVVENARELVLAGAESPAPPEVLSQNSSPYASRTHQATTRLRIIDRRPWLLAISGAAVLLIAVFTIWITGYRGATPLMQPSDRLKRLDDSGLVALVTGTIGQLPPFPTVDPAALVQPRGLLDEAAMAVAVGVKHGNEAAAEPAKYAQAIADFERALELWRRFQSEQPRRADEPKVAELGRRVQARAWGGIGKARALQGDMTGSIEPFHKAVDLDPSLSDIWFSLGYSLSRVAKLPDHSQEAEQLRDQEIDAYRAAITADERNSLAWFNLGVALKDRGDQAWPAAADAYRKAASLRPEDAYVLYATGTHLAALKEYANARPYLARAVQLAPNEPRYRYVMGLLAARLEDGEEFLRQYDAIIALSPEQGSSLVNGAAHTTEGWGNDRNAGQLEMVGLVRALQGRADEARAIAGDLRVSDPSRADRVLSRIR